MQTLRGRRYQHGDIANIMYVNYFNLPQRYLNGVPGILVNGVWLKLTKSDGLKSELPLLAEDNTSIRSTRIPTARARVVRMKPEQ